jgi:hypothetical protein
MEFVADVVSAVLAAGALVGVSEIIRRADRRTAHDD